MLVQRDRDPVNQLSFYASHVAYSLRDADRALGAAMQYLREAKAVHDDLVARGGDPKVALDFLGNLQAEITHARVKFELQMYGDSQP